VISRRLGAGFGARPGGRLPGCGVLRACGRCPRRAGRRLRSLGRLCGRVLACRAPACHAFGRRVSRLRGRFCLRSGRRGPGRCGLCRRGSQGFRRRSPLPRDRRPTRLRRAPGSPRVLRGGRHRLPRRGLRAGLRVVGSRRAEPARLARLGATRAPASAPGSRGTPGVSRPFCRFCHDICQSARGIPGSSAFRETFSQMPEDQTGGPSTGRPSRRGQAYGTQPRRFSVCCTITGAGPPRFGQSS
jgi:hypothetical protein